MSSSKPKYFPKASPPDTIILEQEIQHMILGETQSVHNTEHVEIIILKEIIIFSR